MSKELKKIIKECLKKDQRAQRRLYELCFDRLMQTCTRFHHNRGDAVALLNDGFLKIITNLRKYDFKEDFFPWISTIMVRTAIDQYRRSQRYRTTIELYGDLRQEAREDDLPLSSELVEHAQQDEVHRILHCLSENEKVVFNLFEMEGYCHKEIAEMLDISVRSSKRHLHTAKAALRALLEKKAEVKKVV